MAKFVASQCVLGCVAYPLATAAVVAAYTERGDYTACIGLMTPLAYLTTSGIYAYSYPLKKPMAVASFTGAIDGLLWSSLRRWEIGINIHIFGFGGREPRRTIFGIPWGFGRCLIHNST